MENSKNFKDKVIVALDYDDLKPVKELLDKLKGGVCFYKIGSELFTSCGAKSVELVKDRGCKVFLDLKYHDIPNTVYKAVKAAVKLGVDIINVHASGGVEMMSAAKKGGEEAGDAADRHIEIIAVTVLTNLSDIDINRIFYDFKAQADFSFICGTAPQNNDGKVAAGISFDLAVHLAKLAKISGLDGVVCSGHESLKIKSGLGADFKTVTPGIRMKAGNINKPKDDQKRVMTPSEAFNAGADYIVVGREITGAANPADALARIYADIENNVGRQS